MESRTWLPDWLKAPDSYERRTRRNATGQSTLLPDMRHAQEVGCGFPRRNVPVCGSPERGRVPNGRITLAELTPFPETSEYNGLAAKLAEQARVATLQRITPDLGPRGTVEWMKLDQKLRWLEGHPSRTEEHIADSRMSLRQNCCAARSCRALFDSARGWSELTARFPKLAHQLDLQAIEAAASQLKPLALAHAFNSIRDCPQDRLRRHGAVYEAIDLERNMRVALKTMRHNTAVDLFRFKQEFRSLADIVHPNLVRLYELVSDGQSWLYTMELIDGVDFRSWVRRSGANETQARMASDSQATATMTALSAQDSDTTEVFRCQPHVADIARLRSALGLLVQAVHTVHLNGKLHRDLKPSNVLVQPDGRVVVLDFGLVKDLAEGLSSTGSSEHELQVAGSALYMSPEQAAGRSDLTEASDWYSVGVMLFEALTGQFPFSGRT